MLKLNIRLKRFIKDNETLLVILAHLILCVTTYYLLYTYSNDDFFIPDQNNFLQYDAHWYATIRDVGYKYEANVGNTLAFFPLFPLLWQLTGLSVFGICIFNYILFTLSLIFLVRNQKLNYLTLLLLLSFPSFIFFSLPYSESLFFFFVTFILIGYKKRSDLLMNLGLFGSSLVRSVCVIFIPAIILCELLEIQTEKTFKQRIVKVFYKVLSSFSGLLVAMVYIYLKTDTWFYFITIQKYWHRHWIIPSFPLTTYSPNRVLGLDGITFILGLIAIYICVKEFILWTSTLIKHKITHRISVDPAVLFSAFYISGMVLLDTFFTFYTKGSTNIWSINRHIICTPFFVIFTIYLIRDFRPSLFESVILVTLSAGGVFYTGVYKYINLPVLGFYLLFLAGFCLLKRKLSLYHHLIFLLYYIVALYLQVQFFNDFLNGRWVG